MIDDLYAFIFSQFTADTTLSSFRPIAYIGPGSGLSALGSLIALLAAIFIAVFGFVWFPVKRLFKWFRGKGWLKSADEKSKS